jgi:hypothetical protein
MVVEGELYSRRKEMYDKTYGKYAARSFPFRSTQIYENRNVISKAIINRSKIARIAA